MPLALKPHGDDTGWFSAPFILKPLTEPFPYGSVGGIVAELKGTFAIRVALISVLPSAGQPGLYCSPRRGQGPSSWCQPSLGSGAGGQEVLAPGAPMSRAPQPLTPGKEGGTGISLAAAHPLGIPQQPCFISSPLQANRSN